MTFTLAAVCLLLSALPSDGDWGRAVAAGDAQELAAQDASDYVGEYTRGDGTPIYVAEVDGGLVAIVTGNVFALDARGSGPLRSCRRPGDRVVRARRRRARRCRLRLPGTLPAQRPTACLPGSRACSAAATRRPTRTPRQRETNRACRPATPRRTGCRPSVIEGVVRDVYGDPDYRHVHALLVQKGGVLVLEEYFAGYDEGQPHNLRSATKSVISALVGAATLRGHVGPDDRPLAVIAEAEGRSLSPHKAALTLADMMDMRHGLRCDDWDPESPGNESHIYGEPDWTAFVLSIPDAGANADPGVSYCSAVPLMVGRYLEIATGQPLPQFADDALLSPLGVEARRLAVGLRSPGEGGTPRRPGLSAPPRHGALRRALRPRRPHPRRQAPAARGVGGGHLRRDDAPRRLAALQRLLVGLRGRARRGASGHGPHGERRSRGSGSPSSPPSTWSL